MTDWRQHLGTALEQAARDATADEVRAFVETWLAGSGEPPQVRSAESGFEKVAIPIPAPVLGVDGCPSGWVGVLLQPDRPAQALTAHSIADLVELARSQVAVAAVAIDIPIGLPDQTRRAADTEARAALPGKASSVFSTPTRAALTAPDYPTALAVNRELTGVGLSKQAWMIAPKVREVDDWLRTHPTVPVIEAHPELTFATLAGAPVLSRKRTPDGIADRVAILRSAGLVPPAYYAGQGYAQDDLLDAAVVALTAARHVQGDAVCRPDPPERFSDGWAAAIWT